MLCILQTLDINSMALLAMLQNVSLLSVLICTYAFQKTYPGFLCIIGAQVAWTAGVFFKFCLPVRGNFSIFLGDMLMLMTGSLAFQGLAQYGGISINTRSFASIILLMLSVLSIIYCLFSDHNSYSMSVVFGVIIGLIFFRIATEPYVNKKWKRQNPQLIISTLCFAASILFFAGAYTARDVQESFIKDNLVKLSLVTAIFFMPVLVSCFLAMTTARLKAELCQANAKLRAVAETDALTGLANRRKFDTAFDAEWQRAATEHALLAVIILDVDEFKAYNDKFGHQAGDVCLMALAKVICGHVRRPDDLVARYGGEEFSFILPGYSCVEALAVAQNVKKAVESLRIVHPSTDYGCVSISAGVAARVPQPDEDRGALLREADVALYRAKALGKNMVILA